MKKTITSLMASTMILGQMGGLSALAEEQESIHMEEAVTVSDEQVDEAEDLLVDETLADSSEEDENSLDDESESNTDEDEITEAEGDTNDLYDYAPDYDDPYYEVDPYSDDYYYGENPFAHIESLEVSLSETEIVMGEKIVISISSEGIPEDSRLRVELLSNSGNSDWVDLFFNPETNTYEGTFDFFKSYFTVKNDTTINVSNVELMDSNYNHYKLLYANDREVSAPTIYNNLEVPEGEPIIDPESISISSNEIFDNERIQVQAEIESESDINYVYIDFGFDEYDFERVVLERYKDTNLFIGFFRNYYSDVSTDYTFSRIHARDIFGNETHFYADDHDFSHLTIEYNHVEKPVQKTASYISDSFSVSHSEATDGDKVEVKLKLSDAEFLHQATIYLRNEETSNAVHVELYHDYETDYFVGEWQINHNVESGNYKPDYLYSSGTTPLHFYFDEDYADDLFTKIVTSQKESPTFDINSISFEKSEVEAGTTNLLTLDIDTDEPVDFYLVGLTGFQIHRPAYYNADTGLYEAIIHTRGTYTNEIILYDLYAFVENQHVEIDLEESDFKQTSFTIIPVDDEEVGEGEAFSPVINRDNVSQTESFVTAGETVTVTISIADYSKIASGSVMYQTPLSDSMVTVDLVYNEENKVFEAALPTDETMENGWWKASQILLMDSESNNHYIGSWNEENKSLLNGLDFILSGGVNSGYIEPLTVTSVTTNNESFETGEEVNITVSVTEPRFETLQLTYRMPESRLTRVITGHLNEETGMYEASLAIDDHAESGRWILEHVETLDREKVSGVPVFSDGNFVVVNENSAVSIPAVDTDQYSALYDVETNRLTVRTTVSSPETISSLRVEYRDYNSGNLVVVNLMETDNYGVFEGSTTLMDDSDLGNIRLMRMELIGHEDYQIETINTINYNRFTGIDAAFAEIIVASDEENGDVTPEIPEDDTDEDSGSDDELNQEETDSEDDVEEDEDDTTETDTDLGEAIDEESTASDDDDSTDADTEENEENTNETNSDSGVETDEYNDESTSDVSDDSEEDSAEPGEELDSTEDSDNEQDAEEVDSSTVLPDTATATWTIGMASFVSLLSGLGLRFASKKKRKQ